MHLMQDPHVETLDLRSLRFLARLLETGSVTRAGEACGLSQPTASRLLARLRDALGDPLLVRGQQGHVLTSRAEALKDGVREAEAAIGLVFAQGEFDPATTERVFRVSATEYTMSIGASHLLREVLTEAPRAVVQFEQTGPGTLDALESGELDLAFMALPPPEPFRHDPICAERLVGAVCATHPLAREAAQGGVALDRYIDFPHIQFMPGTPGQGAVDRALAEVGRSRRIAFTTTFFATMWALPGTDLVMSIPARMASLAWAGGIATFDLPLDLPSFPYCLAWHPRSDGDPALDWLRRLALRWSSDAEGAA